LSQQGIQSDPCQFGVLLEMDQVLRQARQRDLRLQNVLLGHLADRVLDPGSLDPLPRRRYVAVMHA